MSCITAAELAIPGVKLLHPRRIADERGFFSETYNQRVFSDAGIDICWIQDNHAISTERGVIRGLHYQAPPHAQTKLVRVVRGAIHDVVFDLRANSPAFGQWLSVDLSADNWDQLLVPAGCAHGYMTLEPHSEVLYKVDREYARDAEAGIRWNDPDLAIDWPLSAGVPIVSRKDQELPLFKNLATPFVNDD